MSKEWRVERLIDGEWYYYGTYESPKELGEAMFQLGKCAGNTKQVRVTECEEKENE